MSFDFLTAIKNIAPMIAGTFGTPLLGLAVSAIAAAVPNDVAQQITDAHAADPQGGALAKISELFQQGVINTAQIKQAENAHAERMAELGFNNAQALEKIAADDRKDARDMQKQTRSYAPAVLASLVTIGFFSILGSMAGGVFKANDNQALLIMLGTLGTSWGAIVQYYFGSSAGSKAKDNTLATIAKS